MFSRERRLQKRLREAETNNRRVQRELQRDQRKIQRDENQLKAEIKRFAAQGDEKACALLARRLIKNRDQVTRTKEFGARMSDITAQQRMCVSSMKLAGAADTGASVIAKMNKQVEKIGCTEIMQRYSKECMKMSMTEEAMNDALDSIYDDSEGEDAVLQQVYNELGIELNEKMPSAPIQSLGLVDDPIADQNSEDIAAQLERLRSS
ncbi:Charged multivesicular body protein 2b-B [Taenia solium]|eukprot:TsM_000461700 transcript=TsM_000461700 gene=TsM_000461700